MTDADLFKTGMRSFASGVSLITTLDRRAVRRGMIATSVVSVSADPPSLLVCVNQSASCHDALTAFGGFCVNLLAEDDLDVACRFSSSQVREFRFSEGDWRTLETGAPALFTALASFDCRVTNRVEAGSHSIFIGEVVAVRLREDVSPPLLYFNRGYARLDAGGGQSGEPAAAARDHERTFSRVEAGAARNEATPAAFPRRQAIRPRA